MINFEKDILVKINSDFFDQKELIMDYLREAISQYDYLKNPRIIRCIVFLVDKSISELIINIERASFDPRDVMLYAEYIKGNKRVRDFNKTFNENNLEGKRYLDEF